ncbi:MAG TPA: PQQ-dependent sugar dehydrogenase [Tepidisphaeraceae bacterium]|nr:PQQ-dependent sugar dehydrogenase [Tepidisphaeraceae bacterium]
MSRAPLIESLEGRLLLSTLPAGFSETTVAKIDTSKSATMAFSPDGRLFVGDSKAGQIRVVKNNALLAAAAVTLSVDNASERGINGIAFAPNFASAPAGEKYVFVYYTRPDPAKPGVNPSNAKNRLSRFTVNATNPDKLDAASERVLLDNINATAGNHNGGALHFGADGMLYLAIGEAAVPSDAQKLSTYGGKVLRLNAMNPANLVPGDNPFANTPGALPLIWALGFRNPFTGAMKPGTSTLYINDVGQSTWEEINHVKKGLNYGWPGEEGNDGGNAAFEDPIFAYHHNGRGIAVTGGAFYNGSQFPSSYNGKYFFGDYVLKTIWWLDEANKKQVPFATATLQVVDIDVNPKDGSLWYLSLNGSVQRISYATGNRAPVAAATASKTSGPTPLTVTFDGGGSSDPDGDALTYSWAFGDGSTATGKTVTHTYTKAGKFNAILTVKDAKGASDAANALAISVGNNAPVPKIELPAGGSLYSGGQTISFKGSATDVEDGTLGASRFDWSVVFHHGTHTHPFRPSIGGVTSGTFSIPKVGEVDPNQWYRVTLTVTDSGGVSKSTSVDVRPRTSTFTLATNVAGLKLNLDGAAKATPLATRGVVGMTRSIAAPTTQTIDGKTYQFVSWSDGKSATHSIDTPATNTTYAANYKLVTGTTTKTLLAVADAYVRDGASSGSNFGLAHELHVKKNNAGFNRESYLRFNLAGISSIASAKILVWGRLSSAEQKNVGVGVHAVANTTWGESTIKFSNKLSAGATPLSKATIIDTAARWYEFDVSTYVKQNAGKLVSFALKGLAGSLPVAIFNSDEHASNKPQLVVTSAATATPTATAAARSQIAAMAATFASAKPIDAGELLESLSKGDASS